MTLDPAPDGAPDTGSEGEPWRPAHDSLAAPNLSIVGLIGAAGALVAGGNPERAIKLYELWLQHQPTDPSRYAACFNYGVLLQQAGQVACAAATFAEATQLNPTFLPAHINAGLALERLGHPDQAVNRWLHVADLVMPADGDSGDHKAAALKHVARAFKSAGNSGSAEEALRRCLEINPHQRDASQHWVAARQMQCKWPVVEPFGRLSRADLVAASSPLGLAIHTDDPMFQLANAWRSFNLDVLRPVTPHTAGRWVPPTPATPRTRRLRIGYVSPDLREHAVGFLTAELFELHNRANVDVFAYYSGRVSADATQTRIRQAADHWRDIAGHGDRQVARQVIDDGIDILVDLGGHTGDAPTAAFALRPAPVVVNWLGFPGSMGTPHHQYIIADEHIIPPAYEKFYSERVVRLPCYQPTDRKRVVAGGALSRTLAGLPDDATVYCCFNGSQKVTPTIFRCWMAILARVPGSVLWLLSCDAATDARLRQRAVEHGVAPDRLVFAARQPNAEHLARYTLADLFLDTWPYGAHTTASDALWMGIPVVTLAGHSFAARVCASLVSAAGLAELVCDSPDAYVERAVDLGAHPDTLVALRDRLRAGRDRCTLFDMPLLVARLEALYRQMWDDYLSGCIPEPDLGNLAIYNEAGADIDQEAAGFTDLATLERRYAVAFAYRDSVSPIPADRRLWPGRAASAD